MCVCVVRFGKGYRGYQDMQKEEEGVVVVAVCC